MQTKIRSIKMKNRKAINQRIIKRIKEKKKKFSNFL